MIVEQVSGSAWAECPNGVESAERLKLSRSEVLPVTYLVDDKGAVRERLIGEQSAAGILAHLERLRGE